MHYTINGKDYTEFDINKRCAEIEILNLDMDDVTDRIIASLMRRNPPQYCKNPSYTWTIIEKCWDELMILVDFGGNGLRRLEDVDSTKWEYIMESNRCTKLVAACICFIEMNEDK